MTNIKAFALGWLASLIASPALAQQISPVPAAPTQQQALITGNVPAQAQPSSSPFVTNGSLDLTGQDRRPTNADQAYVDAAVQEFPPIVTASPVADLDRTLIQGTIIQAVLETAINSDLPGVIRGLVTHDVRSYDGTSVLFPKGSRLFGNYRADLKLNQRRTLIVWTRVITPDGMSVMIGSRGTDRLGRAGQTGFVDTYFDERFGSAALISILGLTPTIVAAEATDNDFATTQAIAELGEDFQRATASTVNDYLRIQPTIYIDQGAIINVITERDVIFPDL
jgi:type IV secretion system protein VirB10